MRLLALTCSIALIIFIYSFPSIKKLLLGMTAWSINRLKHPLVKILVLLAVYLIIIIFDRYNYRTISLLTLAFLISTSSLKWEKREIIFNDDFVSDKGWNKNYWGTTEPLKTNRMENSLMIFEANENETQDSKKEFGAYIDLREGIQEGFTYEIYCKVKSEPATTMGFQLWIHDTVGRNQNVSKFKPEKFFTPSTDFSELTLKYIANSSNAIRIHLHNKAGSGKISVDKLTVTKVQRIF